MRFGGGGLKITCGGKGPDGGATLCETVLDVPTELVRLSAGWWSVQRKGLKVEWQGTVTNFRLTCHVCGAKTLLAMRDLLFQPEYQRAILDEPLVVPLPVPEDVEAAA